MYTQIRTLIHRCCCLVTKSGSTLCNLMDCSPRGCSAHGISQTRKNTGVGCYFLLPEVFSIQGLNPCLMNWQVDFLLLSHQGSPHSYIYIYTYICAQTHPLLYRCVFVHVKKQTPLKDHYYLVKELDFAAEDSPLVLAQSCKA